LDDAVGIKNVKILAGVPKGGIPFGSVVAYKLNKPFIFVRLVQKEHGRERRVEGIMNHGDKVLL
jgi:orotate phosphoribosyltransferase